MVFPNSSIIVHDGSRGISVIDGVNCSDSEKPSEKLNSDDLENPFVEFEKSYS